MVLGQAEVEREGVGHALRVGLRQALDRLAGSPVEVTPAAVGEPAVRRVPEHAVAEDEALVPVR